jgi:serine/threonine protein kinase
MHSLRIIHRDLKPENILINKGQVKICDFGSSKFLDETPGSYKNTPYVVSRYYRAPELIFASNRYNEAIDIWAVGCILFELLTRTPLFPGDTEGLQILEQSCILGTPSEDELRRLGQLVEDKVLAIVRKATVLPKMDLMLLFNKDKYGADQCKMAADLVHKMLRWVPGDRISAAEAMAHPFLADTPINI